MSGSLSLSEIKIEGWEALEQKGKRQRKAEHKIQARESGVMVFI